MKVTLLYVEGCPHWQEARDHVEAALTQLGRVEVAVELQVIGTIEEATDAGFPGSPTVLVNGRDPFGDQAGPVGISCRLYRTAEGLRGSPTVTQLVAALA